MVASAPSFPLRRLASGLLRLALGTAVLCACGGGATSEPDPLPATGQLAPSFTAFAGPVSLVVGAALWADGREQILPEGAQLIAVIGGTRTPLRPANEYPSYYEAELPALGTESNVRIALERSSGVGNASGSSVVMPAPFEILDVPPSITAGEELTIGLSRALSDTETIGLGLRGCFSSRIPTMTRAAGNRFSFSFSSDAPPTGPCEVSATVQISRNGVVDGSFAREYVYADGGARQESSFVASQVRHTKMQLLQR